MISHMSQNPKDLVAADSTFHCIENSKQKMLLENCCVFSSTPLKQSLLRGQVWSSLLLLEECPEADGEVGGVGVDQDAEAQGDAGQAARPMLGK